MNQQRELLTNFLTHINSLHNLQLDLNLADFFLNTYKGKKEKKEKTPKPNKKKNNATNNETAPPENDIISELVNLANGTDYGSPTPTNATTEAPGAPIKEKRKYNRKPKVQNVNEALEVTTDIAVAELVVEAPAEKPVKEKKPRKTKQPVANTEVQQVSDNNIVEAPAVVEAPAEKPVKEKKPRKSNKKTEGTEINL
jgi:hypothetical protein